MPLPKRENLDEYFAALTESQRPHLNELRELSRSFIPQVIETLKWNTPTYVHDGEMMWMLQAFKAHCSLRFSPEFFRPFQDEVEASGYQCGEGFLKIPYVAEVPEALCRRLMEARLATT